MTGVRAGMATDVGHHRALNEDAAYAGSRMFVVADGMGGHAAGDVASRLTVAVLAAADREGVTPDEVRAAVARANSAVLDHAGAHPESAGMGCTLAGACLVDVGGDPHWAVFNLGDARVYVEADGVLRQVTTDHSEVQELVEAGQITRDEARSHPLRNVVTRAVGEAPPAALDLVLLPVQEGQRVLVTSDGLTSEVEDALIDAVMTSVADPQGVAERLVSEALGAGGHDNISVVIVDVASGDLPMEAASTTVPRGLIERENGQ